MAAFNRFLKTVSDENTKTIFQGLFDYQQNKIDSAKTVMSDVLKNGGSLQSARDTYHDALQIPRSDMIRLVNDLNIQAGFSNSKIQDHFDEDGKLPRYDDEQTSVISFVDLTTTQNVNSSVDETTDNTSTETTDNTSTETTDSELIQKLLDEIKMLKNKIAKLEKDQNTSISNVSSETINTTQIHFANWVSDYSQGLGHRNDDVKDLRGIPVNALNAPNSYDDIDNSLALGRNGQVILGFSESVTDNLILYEASVEQKIRERATVEVSTDGKNWTLLNETQYGDHNSYVHEYNYDLSDIGCITHVRITDNSPSIWGDGFDVDALGATKTCTDTT